jgi:hypothetical protein
MSSVWSGGTHSIVVAKSCMIPILLIDINEVARIFSSVQAASASKFLLVNYSCCKLNRAPLKGVLKRVPTSSRLSDQKGDCLDVYQPSFVPGRYIYF